MDERRKMAEGLIAAHIIAFIFASFVTIFSSLVVGLITFALSLPPAAYLSPKILEKLPF